MSIATLETYTVDVCTDCYMTFHAPDMVDVEPVPAPLSRLWDVTILGGCTQHTDPNYGDGCESHGFSWMPCDGCGSVLGGDRYPLAYVVEGGE